jgi:tetratricopeptide (TPR) repeat protein
MRPHETRFRDRLTEIREQYGADEDDEELPRVSAEGEGEHSSEYDLQPVSAIERNGEVIDAHVVATVHDVAIVSGHAPVELSHADEQKIQKELESIEFYIDNDYNELAEKALVELAAQYGDRSEFDELRRKIGLEPPAEPLAEVVVEECVPAKTIGIDEIRHELGIDDENGAVDDSDYDTHYQMAVAYQEMGLMEDAIREFQDAANLVVPNDGTRRYFQAANLLGHCFLQNGMAHHAITWFARALDTQELSKEEYHGLWYELAAAHEANGDDDEAALLFEKIYAENVDFRDVATRVREFISAH